MTQSAHQFQPLDGIRVLELGNYIAAPTTGRLLADFGAEVIKVERPGTGDEVRGWRLASGTTSMLYRTLNRNKRSIEVDLRTADGRALVTELAAKSDVLIENFRPGTLEKWGIGPADLDAVNPRLIYARISAFGQTGPMAERPGFAAVAEAYGGLRELVGDPDRPPVRVGVSIGDTIAGIYGAYGIMLALNAQQSSAEPLPVEHRTVDVALNEAVLSVTESLVPDFSAHGVRRTRIGGRVEGIAPSNAYTCADGRSIVIAGNSDQIFRRLMDIIGRPDLRDDPGLATNPERWTRRDELDTAIGAWCATVTPEAALEVLDNNGVPAGPILTAEDIADDAQYLARHMVQEHPVSDGERIIEQVKFPGVVPVFGGRSADIRNLGPDLGADNVAILMDVLGKSEPEARQLIERAAGRDD